MDRIQPKQINKKISASILVSNITVNGLSNNVTTPITNNLTNAGYMGNSVEFKKSNNESQSGIITQSPYNKVEIFLNSNKKKIIFNDSEVYGRILESSNVYTLYFFYLLNGVEEEYSFLSNTQIDFEFNYRYELKDLPTDFNIQKNINQDINNGGGNIFIEQLIINTTNIIPNLTNIPKSNIELSVNGQVLNMLGANPPFIVVGTAITWDVNNAGYNIDSGDFVVAKYTI